MDKEIEAIGNFVVNNGIQVLMSAIVAWVVYKAAAIGIKYLQQKVLRQSHDELLEKRGVIDNKIKNLIDKTILRLDGDRIFVMEFHNSTQNLVSLPWINMSCNHETFRNGLLPIANNLKHISASLFSLFLTELQQNDFVKIDVSNCDTSMGRSAFTLLALQQESSALSVILRDTQNKPVGYITLKKTVDFTDEDISVMQAIAGQIGALLCAHNSFAKGGKSNVKTSKK